MKIKFLMVSALAAVLALGSGCVLLVAGAAGAGGYAWYNGQMKSTQDATFDKAFNATLAAMKDMQYPVIKQQKDAIHGEIVARNSQDKKISVTLDKVSATATEIHVRVGTFGDKVASQQIMDKIKSRL